MKFSRSQKIAIVAVLVYGAAAVFATAGWLGLKVRFVYLPVPWMPPIAILVPE